ncbi:DUF4387 domain-containing protein [Ramlibacter albus]|uniref:DUF4387 domain-containing protein n=1 Tax=Ramlibacter albus TaxID=2079448 RepID=A0A923M7Y3_9BURK|nr:DUF4387 domain-containing protein [Ramlibacter albus]MBC5764548.1 DUF4387 domain-containing protein [Ramlibacter albus]
MPKLTDVCRHIRSKNAGPFWITVDLEFRDRAAYDAYAHSQALQPAAIAAVFGVDSALVQHHPVPDLLVLKVSYPRQRPQGGLLERDMHGGQQYVRLLDLEV